MNRKFILVLILLAFITTSCLRSGPTKVSGAPQKTASGVEYWDLEEGSGETAVAGKQIKVHYTGWLTDGKKFESTRETFHPFRFVLGKGRVIKGWDEGLVGMKVGGKRQLRIPPELAYGARGFGSTIPPNSTLIFEVELLEVRSLPQG
jgi:FKBP-type peptidyl-prolyl cis-trans isomerase FkpA